MARACGGTRNYNVCMYPPYDGSEEDGSYANDFVWGLSPVVAALVLYAVLLAIGGSRPLCDALTNVLSVAAMLARRLPTAVKGAKAYVHAAIENSFLVGKDCGVLGFAGRVRRAFDCRVRYGV